VTEDAAAARAALRGRLGPLGQFESYRAALDRLGPPGRGAQDVALIGTESAVADGIGRLFEAGAQEVAAVVLPAPPNPPASVRRGRALIGALARGA